VAVSWSHSLRTPLPWSGLSTLSLGVYLTVCASSALAAPAADDWSIERDDRQPELVDQRFKKLRGNPFNTQQWRALERSLGRDGLHKKIEAAARRAPADVGLAVLVARSALSKGEPAKAAATLRDLRDNAGRWRSRVILLEVEAWQAAGDSTRAIEVLESTANGERAPLVRAYELAERKQLRADALRLASALDTGDVTSKLRIARAALGTGDTAAAEKSFAAANKAASTPQRAAIEHEWARATLRANDAVRAATLVWRAIEATSPRDREPLWATLADCHRRDVTGSLTLDRLRRWLEDPKHVKEAAAWRVLAQVETLEGLDPTESWRRAVAADPRDREGLGALLTAVEANGDAEATAAEIRRLGATRGEESAPLALEIASRMIANGHRQLGLSIAGEVENHAGRSTATLVALLDFFNLNGEADHALEIAQRMVKLRPRDPEARIALGEQLLERGQVAEALREWSALPKLIRPRHRGWARHAELLAEHRHPDAILSLQKALAAAPNEPAYLRLRAIFEQDSRVPQRALTSWQELLKRADRPQDRLLRDEARTRVVELLVGTSGKTVQRRNEAQRDAVIALERGTTPEKIEAGLFLAELYSRQERYDDAVRIQEQLLVLIPDSSERLAALALAQRRAGQGDAAMATLERLVEIDPKRSSDVLTELAGVAFNAGDLERALETATRAAAGGADSSRAIVRLGELYERRGDPKAAAKIYAKALELSPRDPLAKLRLAKLAVANGETERASKLYREIVEAGGPPEITQEAGRGALDLAEASENTLGVVELALLRAQREPASEDPRELLLDALDRTDAASLRSWLRAGEASTRSSALSRVLVYSLGRDTIGTRLRAAQHLGQLQLPGSAVPLARVGAQLSPPRDAPKPVKTAYAQARATALFAAGAQRDPAALPIYRQVIANRGAPIDVRYAAAWATLHADAGPEALAPFLSGPDDDVLSTLACIAIARRPALVTSASARAKVTAWARNTRKKTLRQACVMAVAAITRDDDLTRITQDLNASDPHRSAIAAWRLGKIKDPSDAVLVALLRRYLGPKGLGRDAAGASLAHLLGDRPADVVDELPRLQHKGMEMTVSRWLIDETTPRYAPIRPADLIPRWSAVQAALESAAVGTRAEREAYRQATGGCEGALPTAVCLEPLVSGPIDRGATKKDRPAAVSTTPAKAK